MAQSMDLTDNRTVYFLISILKEFRSRPEDLVRVCPSLGRLLSSGINCKPFCSYLSKWEEIKKWHPEHLKPLKELFARFKNISDFYDFLKRDHFEKLGSYIDTTYSLIDWGKRSPANFLELNHKQISILFDLLGCNAVLHSKRLLISGPDLRTLEEFLSNEENAYLNKYIEFWSNTPTTPLTFNWSVWNKKPDSLKSVVRMFGMKTFSNIKSETPGYIFDLLCKRVSTNYKNILQMFPVSKNSVYLKQVTSLCFTALDYVRKDNQTTTSTTRS